MDNIFVNLIGLVGIFSFLVSLYPLAIGLTAFGVGNENKQFLPYGVFLAAMGVLLIFVAYLLQGA